MNYPLSRTAIATAALALICAALAPGWAQRPNPEAQPAGQSADPASLPDQELGRRFTVKPEDLPPPKSGPVVASRPLTLPYQGQTPRVPDGFTATLFASGLEHPRRLLVLPNGDVLVAEQRVGYVTLLRDEDGDGKAEWIQRHVEGLKAPYGLAWRDGHVLVADQDGIWKVPHRLGALRAGVGGVQQKAADVPPDRRTPSPRVVGEEMITRNGVFGIVQGHANRHLAIDPKSGALFVGVGSSGNIGVEPEVKATIQRFEPDGSGQTHVRIGLAQSDGARVPSRDRRVVRRRAGARRTRGPACPGLPHACARKTRSTVGPTPISASARSPASPSCGPTR